MTTTRVLALCSALFFAAATIAFAAEEHAAAKAAKKEGPAYARLERLKALAGTWTGTASHGKGEAMEATVTYAVTGGGSAVVETIFPGTPHEMMTVYTVDGSDLVLTHYCAAGNQPVMKAKKGGDANVIAFDFVRGGNMKPSDHHMHSAVITLVSDAELKSDWASWSGGKAGEVAHLTLTRQK